MLKLSDEFHGPLRLSDSKMWLFPPGTVVQVTAALLSLDQDRFAVIVGNPSNRTVPSLESLWSFKSQLCKKVTCSQLAMWPALPINGNERCLGEGNKSCLLGCFREAMKCMHLCDEP